jgi:hypothetical protein
MKKVLLALSITLLSGSLLAQESPNSESGAGTNQSETRCSVGGRIFDGHPVDGKQSGWLAFALRGCTLLEGSET